jgi:hypothetical protein
VEIDGVVVSNKNIPLPMFNGIEETNNSAGTATTYTAVSNTLNTLPAGTNYWTWRQHIPVSVGNRITALTLEIVKGVANPVCLAVVGRLSLYRYTAAGVLTEIDAVGSGGTTAGGQTMTLTVASPVYAAHNDSFFMVFAAAAPCCPMQLFAARYVEG